MSQPVNNDPVTRIIGPRSANQEGDEVKRESIDTDQITRDRGAAVTNDEIISAAARRIVSLLEPRFTRDGIPYKAETETIIREAINKALDNADEMANAGVIHPTFGIGSLVHYIDICRADDKIKHYPAIVTEVLPWDPGFPAVKLTLFVMGVDAGFAIRWVVLQNPAEQNLPGTWHWPEE